MKKIILTAMTTAILASCGGASNSSTQQEISIEDFNYTVEQFADINILRYRVPGIQSLSLKQQELLYYLNEAALQGRDILFDQNGEYNLQIRVALEAIYTHYTGDKTSDDFKGLELYLKRVWLANGIHHHYSSDKFTPTFSANFFIEELNKINTEELFLKNEESVEHMLTNILPVMFDPAIDAKRINMEDGIDMVMQSAGNYYQDVTQAEAEKFYGDMKAAAPTDQPIMYGMNSKLIKENGQVKEDIYKIDGLYSKALEKVVYWLEKAAKVAETPEQKAAIEQLIQFNQSGSLHDFDKYAVLWVKDIQSQIDFVNGFTESYGDPLGMKASWESIVNFKNIEATKRTEIISQKAQWFENHSPVAPEFRKEKAKGITAKVITASILGGDCYPTSPLGINLPNSNWIRAEHGSKSVTIQNISEAYDQAAMGNGFAEEFVWSEVELELMEAYRFQTDNLHTDLHECLGHGSGKLLPGVDADALKAYGSALEEARADLFGLYFMADPIMVELGLLPNNEAYKAQYYSYFMNGLLTQTTRIAFGKTIEQAHMRNRQLITRWVLEKAADDKSVELRKRDNETFVVINDYELIQKHLGELLYEIQRIKSTGDYEAGKALIETYAVKIDPALHREILDRYAKLNLAPYSGFINPVYTATFDDNGKFQGLQIDYTESYAAQHLRYSKEYSHLTK